MVGSGIYSYAWNAYLFRVIDDALLVFLLAISGSLTFCDVSFSGFFYFVRLFKFFGVSLVMVWCVSCAG
jgi:hypothetical protein